jgi:hypothetical protein
MGAWAHEPETVSLLSAFLPTAIRKMTNNSSCQSSPEIVVEVLAMIAVIMWTSQTHKLTGDNGGMADPVPSQLLARVASSRLGPPSITSEH